MQFRVTVIFNLVLSAAATCAASGIYTMKSQQSWENPDAETKDMSLTWAVAEWLWSRCHLPCPGFPISKSARQPPHLRVVEGNLKLCLGPRKVKGSGRLRGWPARVGRSEPGGWSPCVQLRRAESCG